ncbi:hypothetical protein BABA_19476 [Neobacillus bataviensis LMG 21833]|uniref:Uncharacterized protein n=1 Tax=Neobacillus bataviensis LMG 21833 TaxID=1117379 RepID=K6DXR4_9BACI|nr:hypothetical protein [Neobacillus bataviensis]EKN65646.1 hypothetical protein BABA_19476 [Neobacillus bataviensis LMG 21833]
MDAQGLWSFSLLFVKQFIIYYLIILLGEWFAEKKGYNLFERAWLITIMALSLLIFSLGIHFLRSLRF